MNNKKKLKIQESARNSVIRFSDENFSHSFKKYITKIIN